MKPQDLEQAKSVPMELVLAEAGFNVPEKDGDVQLRCPLHGDGQDQTPSARLFRESNHLYCWGCSKSYDPIDVIQLIHKLAFAPAVEHLVNVYVNGNKATLRAVPRVSPELRRRAEELERSALAARVNLGYRKFLKAHVLLDVIWHWAALGKKEKFFAAEIRLTKVLQGSQ